ncbi:MAG: GNAT family N-acetyltransferase [Spirochaetales bacterium]|nr:GNAT family N-acetyltransferase [Spirochaetales bacterium]
MIKIIDLKKEHEELFSTCLSGDPQRYRDAGEHKLCWYHTMKSRGCRVKIALDESGQPGGMIQYVPSEESFVLGKNLMVMQCIWVLNDKKGRGNFRKKGMGKALLEAFEKDAKKQGKDGVVVWGLTIPVFMQASWFRKKGYAAVDKNGVMQLLWKKLKDSAEPPRWMRQQKIPTGRKDAVTVTCFKNGWCPEINKTLQRAERVVKEFNGDARLEIIDTADNRVMREWGISDALFVAEREIPTGPAPKEKTISKAIKKAVKQLHKEKEK